MDEKRDDNMREQEVKPVSESEDKDVFKYRNTRERRNYAKGNYEPLDKDRKAHV